MKPINCATLTASSYIRTFLKMCHGEIIIIFLLSLFCTNTKKCTIISQIITLLHVSTLSRHPQTACNQYLAKLHKYFNCTCRSYNLQL